MVRNTPRELAERQPPVFQHMWHKVKVAALEEFHAELRYFVGAVEPCDVVVVFGLIKDRTGGLLHGFRREKPLGEKSLVKDAAPLFDVEVAEGDEVLVVGVDVGRPIGHPPGDGI